MTNNEIRQKTKAFMAVHFKNYDLQDDDDIFSLGFVNSLFAMQLVMFVEKEFESEGARRRSGYRQLPHRQCPSRPREQEAIGMSVELTAAQQASQAGFRQFVSDEIAPHANRWDREERMPREVVARLAEKGYLGALIPPEYGGTYTDMITFGLLNEELGRGCSSVRSLITVHGMVQYAILRWGSEAQKKHWLPRLATGKAIGAFGLTEPELAAMPGRLKPAPDRAADRTCLTGPRCGTRSGSSPAFTSSSRSRRGGSARFWWNGTDRDSRSPPWWDPGNAGVDAGQPDDWKPVRFPRRTELAAWASG